MSKKIVRHPLIGSIDQLSDNLVVRELGLARHIRLGRAAAAEVLARMAGCRWLIPGKKPPVVLGVREADPLVSPCAPDVVRRRSGLLQRRPDRRASAEIGSECAAVVAGGNCFITVQIRLGSTPIVKKLAALLVNHGAESTDSNAGEKRMKLEGSCHCGAVRFTVEAPHPYPYCLCYCSICRKTAGARRLRHQPRGARRHAGRRGRRARPDLSRPHETTAASARASASSARGCGSGAGSGTRAGPSFCTPTPPRSTPPCRCRPSAPT